MKNIFHSSSYSPTVRSAHGLADLLKKTRPQHCAQVEELQGRVTRAHNSLHEWNQTSKFGADLDEQEAQLCFANTARTGPATAALTDLGAAYQALRDLKHADTAEA